MAYEPHSGKADRAAYYLMERLRDEPWFLSVGVGEKHGSQCLFLYVRKPKIPKLKMIQDGWHGYPVYVSVLSPRPADSRTFG